MSMMTICIDHGGERRLAAPPPVVFLAFHELVDLHRALPQQEEAAQR